MRVLIAGATGAVGRPLARMLVGDGHEVYALSRSGGAVPGTTTVTADALDRTALLRAVDGLALDAVVHQLTALRRTPTRESLLARTNALRTTGTGNLLAAARETGAERFVAQAFYLGYGFGDHGAAPLTEEAPYGAGASSPTIRALGEMEKMVFAAGGVSLRYGGFYGAGATDDLVAGLRRRRIPVVAGGPAPWVYIDDAASATVAALSRGGAGRAYNICDDEPVSWAEMITEMARAFGAPPPRRLPAWLLRPFAPYAAGLMAGMTLRLSNARAAEELGWRPTVPGYREGLARAAATRADGAKRSDVR